MIKKITIIGVGLIGGSLAKAIKNNNLAEVVFGFGRRGGHGHGQTRVVLLGCHSYVARKFSYSDYCLQCKWRMRNGLCSFQKRLSKL